MWRSIRVKLVLVYVLLILFAVELIGAYFVRTLNASLIGNDTQTVTNQAQLIATIATPAMQESSLSGDRPSILSSIPQVFNGVVYILDKNGVVVDTSAATALIGQKRIDSVATQALVSHTQSVAIHYDTSTEQHLLALAVPILSERKFLGIVECVVPIQNTYTTVRQVTTIYYTGSALVMLLTVALGIVLSRTISKPVIDVIEQTKRMAAGDFTARVTVHSTDEFGDLSQSINDLADKLDNALALNYQERERLRAVITYMGDGVVAFDTNLQVMFQNDAATRLLRGVSARSVANVVRLEEQIQSGQAEQTFLESIGSTVLHIHVTAIRKQGQTEGYVAILRDVTEQEKLQEARRDFVANVSHELRTPLTSVKSYIEALQETDLEPEHQQRFLQVVSQEADRMVRLTEDLLQLSGLESGTMSFHPSTIEMKTWLTDAVNRFLLPAEQHGVSLELYCPRSTALRGDRDMLDRLMDNLLSNALKYTSEGGKVEVNGQVGPEEIRIRVEDSGMGIPEDDLPHVFERFYRVDKARSRRMGGTGLGLALARDITERHGGNINITSEVGKGTVVYVRLPRMEGVR